MPTVGSRLGREIDLVRRHLDDMDPPHARRLQRQDRGADIAAHLGVVTGDPHQMRDQRGGGRFAVGAGDGDERRIRRMTAPFAAEQLDIADHLDAGLARRKHRPVRRGMGQRRAGRQHQRREIRPRYLAQIRGDEARLGRFGQFFGAVVAGDHLGAARPQGVAARQPRAAEAEHRDRLAREGSDGDHDLPVIPDVQRTRNLEFRIAASQPRNDEGMARHVTAASAWRGRPAPASPR